MRNTSIAISILVLALMMTAPLPAKCADMEQWSRVSNVFDELGLSAEDVDEIKDLLDERVAPIIESVTVEPEAPTEDEPVTVTAAVVTPMHPYGEEIFEVYLVYSTDGGETFDTIEMNRLSDDNNQWEGEIPGQPSGTDVIFGLQAQNVYDELLVETVCKTPNVFDALKPPIPEECKGARNEQQCAASLPADCMFPMSFSSRQENSYGGQNPLGTPEDMIIVSTRFGYDEDNLFIVTNVKGEVTAGTLSPMDANIYVTGWINPDKSSETGMDAVLKQGAITMYAPLNTTNKCALYYLRGADIVTDDESVSCAPEDNHLVITLDRDAVGDNPSGALEFVFLTFRMFQISPSEVEMQDLTHTTRISFQERGYFVE